MWQEPKTDWFGQTVDGVYEGDRFNAVDYNRIKNNLAHLREMALKLYEEFEIVSPSEDKTFGDYFYADEINIMEDNLKTINDHTLKRNYGIAPVYGDNTPTMDYNELNRLEGAILDLYEKLTNQLDGLRKFTWNFGMKGGPF